MRHLRLPSYTSSSSSSSSSSDSSSSSSSSSSDSSSSDCEGVPYRKMLKHMKRHHHHGHKGGPHHVKHHHFKGHHHHTRGHHFVKKGPHHHRKVCDIARLARFLPESAAAQTAHPNGHSGAGQSVECSGPAPEVPPEAVQNVRSQMEALHLSDHDRLSSKLLKKFYKKNRKYLFKTRLERRLLNELDAETERRLRDSIFQTKLETKAKQIERKIEKLERKKQKYILLMCMISESLHPSDGVTQELGNGENAEENISAADNQTHGNSNQNIPILIDT